MKICSGLTCTWGYLNACEAWRVIRTAGQEQSSQTAGPVEKVAPRRETEKETAGHGGVPVKTPVTVSRVEGFKKRKVESRVTAKKKENTLVI